MSIIVSYDEQNGISVTSEFDKYRKEVVLSEKESFACGVLERYFNDRGIVFSNCIRLQRRSNSYLSFINQQNNDFLRLKAGVKSSWISIDTWKMSEDMKNDSRFDNVKNKNQRHWKILLDDLDDIKLHCDLIIAAYFCYYE